MYMSSHLIITQLKCDTFSLIIFGWCYRLPIVLREMELRRVCQQAPIALTINKRFFPSMHNTCLILENWMNSDGRNSVKL